jgi:hypothetical protein
MTGMNHRLHASGFAFVILCQANLKNEPFVPIQKS